MANQTISVDTNHDSLIGRLSGEDITINSGAKLLIDSIVHLTSSGILGVILINDGEIHIDGTRTYEVTYSNGSGSLPSVGSLISWNGGTDTGKIIRLNSGDNSSGILTLTKDVGVVTPDDSDSITDGSWTADLDNVKIGYLIVYGESQVWNATNALATFRTTGDWYELGVGDGTDNQAFTLPHNGVQWAVWVETGSGTGIFEIWHKLPTTETTTVFYNSLTEFGTTWENGAVFNQVLLANTITFGTSTNGGVVPNGARIRIPNVHIGTTTVGAPGTEVVSITATNYIDLLGSNVNENVFIDHLNGSTVGLRFIGTNSVDVTDSCWGNLRGGNFINEVNTSINITNAFVGSGVGLTNDLPATILTILDNIGGINFTNCVFCAGTNTTNGGVIVPTTSANINFLETCKIVSNQKDENTMATLRGSVALNVYCENLVSLGGSVYTTAGCSNWIIDNLIFGLPLGRGTTEENMNILNSTATVGLQILNGRKQLGGKVGTLGLFLFTDCDQVIIRNFGEITNKIDLENRATYVISLDGISTNIRLNRLWFDNMNSTSAYQFVNSVADVTIENCSGEYTDEIEVDANRVLIKGLHGASGSPNTATGVEGDLVNCLASVFLDYFKSNTTGALGLIFNDRGVKHLNDVIIVSGTPIWDGLGGLRMRTINDEVIFEYPYSIKGHTSFQNSNIQLNGVNTNNLSYEYDLDNGTGYSGVWKIINGSNLSSETISPSGFKFKIRIICTVTNSGNIIRGLGVLTNTTLVAQENNLYPLDVANLTLSGLIAGSEVRAYTGNDPSTAIEIAGIESSTTSFSFDHSVGGENGYIMIISLGYQNLKIPITYSNEDQSIPIQQIVDRQYLNP